MVIGAAAAAVAAIAVAGFFVTRDRSSPTAQGTGSSGQAAPSTPSTAVQNPQKGAEKAEARLEEQAKEAEDTSTENLAAGRGRSLAEMAVDDEIDDTELISRFVLNMEGDRVGETMTITDGEVILKRDGEFFSVAPDAIIEKNGTLLADATIDWDHAREAGKQWEEENLDRMEYDDAGMPAH